MSFCCLRRCRAKDKKSSKKIKAEVGAGLLECETKSSQDSKSSRISSEVNGNVEVSNLTHPVSVQQLGQYVKQGMQTGELKRQHEMVPEGQLYAWKRALDPNVADKNRYAKQLPYDNTRVILQELDGVTGSDYINASYIDGYCQPKAYIATQGPKENTCSDFWRMVWQENVTKIVMLTNIVEIGRKKCEQYWPDTSASYGNITVTTEKTDTMADYAVRTMVLQKSGHGTKRQVKQFHFTSWPDHGVPSYPCVLVSFLKKVKAYHVPKSGPTVVHCSAGIGRTGTVILLDTLLDMGRMEGRIDAVKHLYTMRQQRANILINFEQYEFVHLALLEALLGTETSIPCSDFGAAYHRLWKPHQNSPKSQIEQQFEVLGNSRPEVLKENCRAALEPANISKNRKIHIIPEERHRPYLKTFSSNSTDYINAVYVQGYKVKDAYLATQFPLQDTLVDFWRLVADHNCNLIVVLNDEDSPSAVTPKFWPESEEIVTPLHSVHTSSVTAESDVTIRRLKVTNRERSTENPRDVVLLHYRGWKPDAALPPSAEGLLKLVDRMSQFRQEKPSGLTLITCYDGSTACGLFCAISFLCEKMKFEQEVDAFLAVSSVSSSRPSFVNSMEQYAFCYEAALVYLNSFQTYPKHR